MAFELDASLRRLGARRRTEPLNRRPDEELSFVGEVAGPGPPLLLDSTVYIDTLRGSAPPSVKALLRSRRSRHSSVCLAELTHAFGRLDPTHSGTNASLAEIRGTILDIPHHHLSAPDVEMWGAAGVLTGLLLRLGGHGRGRERPLLNDALLYLQARKLGCCLLTANVADFDLLQQLVPDGRLLLYRPA